MRPRALQSAVNGTFLGVSIVPTTPAMARALLELVSAHSLGILLENAVIAQCNQFTLGSAVTGAGAKKIYSLNSIANAASISRVL